VSLALGESVLAEEQISRWNWLSYEGTNQISHSRWRFRLKRQLTGTLGVVSVTLGGAAVVWLGALLVIYNVFPEKTVEDASEATIQLRINKVVNRT